MPENETHTQTTDEVSYGTTPEEILAEQPQISSIPVIPQLSVALGLLIFVFALTYIGLGTTDIFTKKTTTVPLDTQVETLAPSHATEYTPLGALFEGTKLEAKSAIVWDVQKQRLLFNKNADDQLPLASITKLMTALVTYELLDPNEKVAITLEALQTEGDSGFRVGEEFTVKNLTDITLIASSNDGASALGASVGSTIMKDPNPESVFVTAMNIKAKQLGLTKTYFENSTGLDVSTSKAGAYGSARDVALLMEYIITTMGDAVEQTTQDIVRISNESGAYHITKNTNDYVGDMTGLIASKTGYTNLSGGNLVVAVDAGLNRPIIVVVLGSSYNGRFTDTLDLLRRAQAHIAHESE